MSDVVTPEVVAESPEQVTIPRGLLEDLCGIIWAMDNKLEPLFRRTSSLADLLYMEGNCEDQRLTADEQWSVMTIAQTTHDLLDKHTDWTHEMRCKYGTTPAALKTGGVKTRDDLLGDEHWLSVQRLVEHCKNLPTGKVDALSRTVDEYLAEKADAKPDADQDDGGDGDRPASVRVSSDLMRLRNKSRGLVLALKQICEVDGKSDPEHASISVLVDEAIEPLRELGEDLAEDIDRTWEEWSVGGEGWKAAQA